MPSTSLQIWISSAPIAAPMILAEKTTHYGEAQEIAEEGLRLIPTLFANDRDDYPSDESFEFAVHRALASCHDALGWVAFHENRLKDAERSLLKAEDLNQNYVNQNHLGRLYERLQRFTERYVEELWMKG